MLSFGIRHKRTYIDKFRHTGYTPEEVGNFAISTDGDFTGCDTTTYPTMKPNPSPPFDLNVGYNPVTYGVGILDRNVAPHTFPKWESGLRWITESSQGYSTVNDVQVVAGRQILREIGYTNHNYHKNPWTFAVCKFRGKVYIRGGDNVPRHYIEEFNDDQHKINCYWGQKFKDYMIDDDPNLWYCHKMIKAKLGNTNVLITADVDAVDSSSGDHVELHTCYAKYNTLRSSLTRAWLQNFLGNNQCLHYGIKDEDGIIRAVPTKIQMSSKEIPLILALRDDDKDAMMGFLSMVLEWLCDSLLDQNAMWLMTYDGNSTISLKKSGVPFLPEWYVEFLDKKQELEGY